MKQKQIRTFGILLIWILATTNLQAQPSSEILYINAPKFVQALVASWIDEFSKAHPNTNIQLLTSTNQGQIAQLNLVVEPTTATIKEDEAKIVYAARYALVPVTNARNGVLAQIGKKRLNKKNLEKLFFEPQADDEDADDADLVKSNYQATVYTAENQLRLSSILANHYGHLSSELRGKKILGDEIHLISALKKDTSGISFNSLNYVFDLTTRQLKPELALLPIDVKKDARPQLNGSADDVIRLLETEHIETIPVGRIGFAFNQTSNQEILVAFLQWTLTEGQKNNHKYGFLESEKMDLNIAQRELQTGKLLTLK